MKITDPSWQDELSVEFTKPYFKELTVSINKSYVEGSVFPTAQQIFRAFELCPFNQVKVVILGQDPYHGEGQAHGLSFSVSDGVKIPPSLKNIYQEIQNDLDLPIPSSGNLERWTKQGVLLLNSTLTVASGLPGSHQGLGWETFTDAVIKKISDEKIHVVFLLWGKYAQAKEVLIDTSKHLILKAPHPSPFSAYTGFFGCKHFSQSNNYLKKYNLGTINW